MTGKRIDVTFVKLCAVTVIGIIMESLTGIVTAVGTISRNAIDTAIQKDGL